MRARSTLDWSQSNNISSIYFNLSSSTLAVDAVDGSTIEICIRKLKNCQFNLAHKLKQKKI